MSDEGTIRFLEAYIENVLPMPYFTGLFRAPPENFHRSKLVEIDIVRSEPRIAIPVPGIKSGPRRFENTKFVNKGFTPAVFDEETSISAYTKLDRREGRTPFDDPAFVKDAMSEAASLLREGEGRLRRAFELQCAQVLTEGAITSKDEANATVYSCDFGLKATHFATVGTTWHIEGSAGTPLKDIGDLCQIIRRDGKNKPTRLSFGTTALRRFLANADVKEALDNRRFELGQIAPQAGDDAATQIGWVWIGPYRLEIWLYDDTYVDPVSGDQVTYLNDEYVVITCAKGRLDATYGEIPMFVPPDARAARFLPPRISAPGVDLTVNAYVTPDGKHLNLQMGTRPLAIPTAGDTFGRLKVTT